MKPALFSANSEGACPTCNGNGLIYTELGIMDDGRRPVRGVRGQALPGEVLEYKLGGRDISEVLAMPVAEALEFFGSGDAKPRARSILARCRTWAWATCASGSR